MTNTGEIKTDGTLNKLKKKKETINPNTEAVDANQLPEKKEQGVTFAEFVQKDSIQARFNEMLKERSGPFLTSLVALYNNDSKLKECDPVTVVQSAMVAASLDLPIEKNFGYAWILPYKNWKTGVVKAQFQMGYKGYIQLALRTGQYKKINCIKVYEGQLVDWDDLTEELIYDRKAKKSDKVVGYAAYYKLLSGFEKTVYWSKEEIEAHRIEYNKAKDKKELSGAWALSYDSMAMKVVLNNLLKKWGILSTEMRSAIIEEESGDDRQRKIINLDELPWEGQEEGGMGA